MTSDCVGWLQLPEWFCQYPLPINAGMLVKYSGSCSHPTPSNVIVQISYSNLRLHTSQPRSQALFPALAYSRAEKRAWERGCSYPSFVVMHLNHKSSRLIAVGKHALIHILSAQFNPATTSRMKFVIMCIDLCLDAWFCNYRIN